MHQQSLITALAAALVSVPAVQAGIYTKSSPVIQADAKNFDSIVAKSNHTSIVEFYAPWCGHCQNLKPAYEKAAKDLDGLAKVVAVNCDEDSNKPLCGAHGIQGFPTLKTFRPGKKPGSKPIVEDYQGPRTANGIAQAVADKINNHVTRLTDSDFETFVAKEGPDAILFTEKGTTSALLRSVAIDFMGVINVAQIRSKETKAVEKYGIQKFPTLVLIPADSDAEPIIYEGELNKKDIVAFLKQAGEPNPDPAPAKSKAKADKKETKEKKEPKSSSTSSSTKSEETAKSSSTESARAETTIISIPHISSNEQLVKNCLHRKAAACLIVNIPAGASENGDKVLKAVSELNTKYHQSHRPLFPFFSLSSEVEGVSSFKSSLGLTNEVELIAVNAKRKWWKQYEGDFDLQSVEAWLDAVRLGDGEKKKLPKEVIVDLPEKDEPASSATESEKEAKTEEAKTDEKITHEEL